MTARMALSTPRLKLFQGDGTNFMLADPLPYEIEVSNVKIVVPQGFVTDFASVPGLARAVISVLGRHSIPALLHDYLYWVQPCGRRDADRILRNAMTAYHSKSWERFAVYWIVRAFGWWPWHHNAKERAEGLIKILPQAYQELPLNKDWEDYRRELFAAGVTEPPIDTGLTAVCKAAR